MSWQSFSGEVNRCDEEGGWYSMPVPLEFSEPYKGYPGLKFGFIPITARVGSSTWDTSFLPNGKDNPYFITFPAKIRKAQHIDRGDNVVVEFCYRSPLA